jgi:hypothetical protein
VFAIASANIAFSCALVGSLDCRSTGLRMDTTLSTGRAHAARSDGVRLGTDTILGFAVGGLCPRFKPIRNSLAHTELRLWPKRLAIWPALRPLTQSFFRSAILATSHMVQSYTPLLRMLTISPLGSYCTLACDTNFRRPRVTCGSNSDVGRRNRDV